jgi:hypothetical protein
MGPGCYEVSLAGAIARPRLSVTWEEHRGSCYLISHVVLCGISIAK